MSVHPEVAVCRAVIRILLAQRETLKEEVARLTALLMAAEGAKRK